MSKMIEIAGVKVSEDTIKGALKKHCGFGEKPKQLKVYCFRANRMKGTGYVFRLGCVKNSTDEWNGYTMESEKGRIGCFNEIEVKQIITGLQKLLEEN